MALPTAPKEDKTVNVSYDPNQGSITADFPSEMLPQMGDEQLAIPAQDQQQQPQVEQAPENTDTPDSPAPEPQPQQEAPKKATSWLAQAAKQDEYGHYGAGLEEEAAKQNAPVTPASQKMGPIQAGLISAASEALPTAAALATFHRGGMVGAAAAGLAGIETGPFDIPIAGVGYIVGGLAASIAAGSVTKATQDAILGKTFKETEAKARKDQPVASMVGGLVPQAAAMRPSLSNLTEAATTAHMILTDLSGARKFAATPVGREAVGNMVNVMFGAGSQVATEAVNQISQGKFDGTQLALAAVFGAILNKPTEMGNKLMGVKPHAPEAVIDEVKQTTPEELTQMLLPLSTDIEQYRMRNGLETETTNPPPKAPEEPATPRTDNLEQQPLPLSTEIPQPEFKLEGETGAFPAPKTLSYDETGQSSFDFFGELAPKEPSPTEGAPQDVSGVGEPPAASPTENPDQAQLPLETPPTYPSMKAESSVADMLNSKAEVRANFNGTKGILSVQNDTLVLTPLGKKNATPIEVGPIGENGNRRFNEFEGLKLLRQNKPKAVEAPATTPEAPAEKSKLESWADNTIKEARGRLNTGLDPELLGAYAVKGAYHFARGAKTFAEWAGKMIAEFGDAIKPHLSAIWAKSLEIHNNPQVGAQIKMASDLSTPKPSESIPTAQANATFERYFNSDEVTLNQAASATGLINLNSYDPNVSGTKLVAAVATTIENQLRKAQGPTRTLEARVTDAVNWMKDNGYAEALSALQNDPSKMGLRRDAEVVAQQMLLVDAKLKLKAAADAKFDMNTPEADAAYEAAWDHFSKVMLTAKQNNAEIGRALNAIKQNADWQRLVDAALNAENPDRALSKLPLTGKQIAIGAAREILLDTLLGYTSSSITLIGGSLNGLRKSLQIAAGGLMSSDVALREASFKNFSYLVNSVGEAWRNARLAFATNKPVFTSHTSIDEARGGMLNNPQQYGGQAWEKYRSRGFVSSETLGLNPKDNPFWAPVADIWGELVRSSQRAMLFSDEFTKTAFGMAYAKSRFHYEGMQQGITDPVALQKYVQSQMDTLVLRDGSLYTKENLLRQIASDVRDRGLTGEDAIHAVDAEFKAQYNTQMGEVAKMVQQHAEEVAQQEPFPKKENGDPTVLNTIYEGMQKHPLVTLGLGMYYFRQPMNAFRQFGQTFPLLNKLSTSRAAEYASGDPFRVANVKGQDAYAYAITMLGALGAYSGMMVGAGPRNPEANKVWRSEGNIPWSFRIPKNSDAAKALFSKGFEFDGSAKDYYFIEFRRLDPIATHLQLFASLSDFISQAHYDNDSNFDDKLQAGFTAVALAMRDLVTEKSGLNNLKQLAKFADPNTYSDGNTVWDAFKTYASRRVAPVLVPAMISKVGQSTDDVATQARTFLQVVAGRLGEEGIMREGFNSAVQKATGSPVFVPKQYNIFGEPIDKAVSSIAPLNVINPFLISDGKDDELIHEANALQHNWSAPQRYHSPNGDTNVWDMRDYTNKETGQDAYDRYNQLIGEVKINGKGLRDQINGKGLRDQLTKMVNSSAYKKLPDQGDVAKGYTTGKVDMWSSTLNIYRQAAFAQVLKEYPDFAQVAIKKQSMQAYSKFLPADQAKQKTDKVLNSPSFQKIIDFGSK